MHKIQIIRLWSGLILSIFICIIFLIYHTNQGYLKHENIYPYDSLNVLLYETCCTHKCILLADSYHGRGYYKERVISFLRYWLNKTIADSNYIKIPSKLILFLEIDKNVQENFCSYIKTGDSYSLLSFLMDKNVNYSTYFFTIDNLIFLYELRDINEEISKANQNRKNKIELRLIGSEANPPYNDEDIVKMSKEEFEKKRIVWFANERDRLSSMNIKNELDTDPDYKALIFYGSAHLLRGIQMKGVINTSPFAYLNKTLNGYYLAHCLDSIIGRNQVSVFTDYSSESGRNHQNESTIERLKFSEESPDFVINNVSLYPLSHCPIFFIRNRMTLKTLIVGLNKYGYGESKLDVALRIHYIKSLYYQLSRSYLYTSPVYKSKIDFIYRGVPEEKEKSHVQQIIKIGNELINSFDAVKNIMRLDEWVTNTNLPDSTIHVPMMREIIRALPSSALINEDTEQWQSKFRFSENEKKQILKRKDELIQYSLIILLWIASPSEKEAALQGLQKMTGMNYQTTENWSEWWISKYRKDNRLTRRSS